MQGIHVIQCIHDLNPSMFVLSVQHAAAGQLSFVTITESLTTYVLLLIVTVLFVIRFGNIDAFEVAMTCRHVGLL